MQRRDTSEQNALLRKNDIPLLPYLLTSFVVGFRDSFRSVGVITPN